MISGKNNSVGGILKEGANNVSRGAALISFTTRHTCFSLYWRKIKYVANLVASFSNKVEVVMRCALCIC